MLLPERLRIRSLFPDGFANPREILTWMQTHMEILPDQGIDNYYPSAFGCLRCRQVPAFAYDMVFVALCRVFRFPSRLEPHSGTAQWMANGVWHSIRPQEPTVNLTIQLSTGKKLNASEHFSLGFWDGEDFITLKHPDLTLEGSHTYSLQPGLYRITATTRQIDGTASVALWHMTITEDTSLQLNPPEDQTSQRLKQIPLQLPEGPLQKAIKADPGRNLLLIFADPGSEPTEHLLREMLDCAQDFRALPCRVLLLTETQEALTHPSIQIFKSALPEAELHCLQDPAALAALHLQMQVGDLRLPFVICADRRGQGVYADANYRIRLVQTLLDIQKLLVS